VSLDTQSFDQPLKTCPHCGACIPATALRCSSCGGAQDAPSPEAGADSLSWPHHLADTGQFDAGAIAILQFLPSGTCVSLALARPVVLGYDRHPSDTEDVLDLTEFNAARHGVCCRHCRLQRHETHLIITDLGSVAGTRLNGEVLAAHDERIVRHGDRLVIGTLHVIITFNTIHS